MPVSCATCKTNTHARRYWSLAERHGCSVLAHIPTGRRSARWTRWTPAVELGAGSLVAVAVSRARNRCRTDCGRRLSLQLCLISTRHRYAPAWRIESNTRSCTQGFRGRGAGGMEVCKRP
jgi:hypothetical protein